MFLPQLGPCLLPVYCYPPPGKIEERETTRALSESAPPATSGGGRGKVTCVTFEFEVHASPWPMAPRVGKTQSRHSPGAPRDGALLERFPSLRRMQHGRYLALPGAS